MTRAVVRDLRNAPNFFLVGAPKSGTTAMHVYLGQHPEVFMPPAKAPSYFSRELGIRTAWNVSEERYLSLYADATTPIRGDASPSYLFSPNAATSIRAFNPDARILIMLRNPLETIQALHSEARKYGLEMKRDFDRALAVSDRGGSWFTRRFAGPWTRYRELVHFADQVERYLSTFPRDQVHIELYDDLRADPAATYHRVLAFLGVDPGFRTDFRAFNLYRGEVRSGLVQLLVLGTAARPGTRGQRGVPFDRLRRKIAARNVTKRPRRPLPPALRAELVTDLAPDVERLGTLLDRDLTHWLADPTPIPS